MYRESKPMLVTGEEKIQNLKDKGIKFELISEADAIKYLDENNNFFKLRAYRKNFQKQPVGDPCGKYDNLDFAMLKDLAIIDMRMRYEFIHMTLDVEHFSKVKLLRKLEANGEDGYQVVEDYLSQLQTDDEANDTHFYQSLLCDLQHNKNNPYCGGIIEKYDGEYPVWGFVEIVPFGTLIHFLGFCANRLSDRELKDDYYLLLTIKQLRNASAHSNCLINDLGSKNSEHELNFKIARAIPNTVISKETRKSKTKNECMRQIVTLIYTHSRMIPSVGVRDHCRDELHSIVERMFKHKNYYTGNDLIIKNFEFFANIVDIFYP